MKTFRDWEQKQQHAFKENWAEFSDKVRGSVASPLSSRSSCLPEDCALENLFPPIRDAAIEYFREFGIEWQGGSDDRPSPDLCASQVCCVNFLFPLSLHPEALARILKKMYPDLRRMLPMEEAGHYMAFEWIGNRNYLHETLGVTRKRTRGAQYTGADAAVLFDRNDSKRQLVLIEWTYTEAHDCSALRNPKKRPSRSKIYGSLLNRSGCPIKSEKLPNINHLFHEPFDEMMRIQLLCREMEHANEFGADTVSVLHVTPSLNTEFQRIIGRDLRKLGSTTTEVWKNLMVRPDRYQAVHTEDLFGNLNPGELPGLENWVRYISERYPWVNAESISIAS